MLLKRFDRSILNIPEEPGTFWITALNTAGRQVIIFGRHSQNVKRSILQSDQKGWLKDDLHSHSVYVLLDENFNSFKEGAQDGNH